MQRRPNTVPIFLTYTVTAFKLHVLMQSSVSFFAFHCILCILSMYHHTKNCTMIAVTLNLVCDIADYKRRGNKNSEIFQQYLPKRYTWNDSDVIVSTLVTAAMLEVHYAAAV